MLEIKTVNHIACKCFDNILDHPKFCGSKHLFEPAHLSYACTIFGGSTKEVNWQK